MKIILFENIYEIVEVFFLLQKNVLIVIYRIVLQLSEDIEMKNYKIKTSFARTAGPST